MSDDLSEMLYQWEENYKKGLLTFWMLLSLTKRPMYAYEMKEEIYEISQRSVTADEKSIYRALKRFADADLIEGEIRPSNVGPARKYFALTTMGCDLLTQFIRRNILAFSSDNVAELIMPLLLDDELQINSK